MNSPERKNWLHLDLKGAIPSVEKLLEQLRYFKECGYNGIVWEYDDRIPWRSFPNTWRGGYSAEEHRRLMDACRELGLEVVPLIQVMGHLEWLLKHEEYRGWRENGVGSELCPLHPEVLPRLKRWIDEVIEIHPGSRFIHLGADETLYIGSCEKCRTRNKMDLYLEHISSLCRYALSKGLRPLIWADMFLREGATELAAALPEGTVLVDWQYDGEPPYDSTRKLMQCGREVMGASGVMVGWLEHCCHVQSIPEKRFRNVVGWDNWAEKHQIGMIHTTWTRASSFWNIYGPWIGALPVFVAAGNPERWKAHPWHEFMNGLTGIMERDQPGELRKSASEVLELPVRNAFETECRRWWNLALRYQSLQKQFLIDSHTRKCLDRVVKYVGRDDVMYNQNAVAPFVKLKSELDQWESEARRFWHDNELSNEEEFFDSHSGILKDEIFNYCKEI